MRRSTLLTALFVLAGCGVTQPIPTVQPDPRPETAAGGMVASAHPLASEAGVEMLRRGGNAVDAAVATAFAVGVVEPMMAGIGGSGGMLIWEQETESADYLDFYARAPSYLPDDAAERRSDHPARLVAVPGTVAGLLEALDRKGTLPRDVILAPAIGLAEEGFPISGLLARTIAADSAKLTFFEASQDRFWPGFRPLSAGERLIQPELAATMRRIAAEGARGFHEGPVAREIVELLQAGGNPIALEDLAGFEPVWRRPVCGTYRGRTVLSAPPPQSGMQIIQTLHLLDRYELNDLGLPLVSADAMHVVIQALRTATSDRRRYLGDPDAVPVPAAGLTAPGYIRERAGAAATDDGRAARRVEPGDPWPFDGSRPGDTCQPLDPFPAASTAAPPLEGRVGLVMSEASSEEGETTHISVVDGEGNAVSLTFTQGAYFGSGAWAAGTFLNNAMAIFSDDPESPNYLQPGRAPASTTAPTVVLEDGRVRMVVGSPGGGRIPHAIVQAMVYTLDFGLGPAEALRMPRIYPHFSIPRVEFEQGVGGEVLEGLHSRGYELEVHPPKSLYFGGVHMVELTNGQWVGAADPRRDGAVRGH